MKVIHRVFHVEPFAKCFVRASFVGTSHFACMKKGKGLGNIDASSICKPIYMDHNWSKGTLGK